MAPRMFGMGAFGMGALGALSALSALARDRGKALHTWKALERKRPSVLRLGDSMNLELSTACPALVASRLALMADSAFSLISLSSRLSIFASTFRTSCSGVILVLSPSMSTGTSGAFFCSGEAAFVGKSCATVFVRTGGRAGGLLSSESESSSSSSSSESSSRGSNSGMSS